MDNLWIGALSPSDRGLIEPHLHRKAFTKGQTLFDVGQDVGAVWFPLSGVVSLMTVIDDERMVETAAIGREGLVGVTCGPLNGRAVSRAVSQSDGVAACVDSELFSGALSESETLRASLARFTENLLAQVQQTAACNAQHKLEERLARWLLTLDDRLGGEPLRLTQHDIAGMLGVRRATVSEVGSVLEDKRLIERGRGSIRVLDRKGLEAAACGCYATMRRVAEELDIPSPA